MKRETVGSPRCEEFDCCETKTWPRNKTSKERVQASVNIFRELAYELHKPLTRRFTRRCVIAKHVDLAGVALAF